MDKVTLVLDMTRFNTLLFDMDGVLYRGPVPLPGVNDLLALCARRGMRYACITNNSTMTPAQYEAKLAGMGIQIPAAQIVTSSVATRRVIEREFPRGTRAFYIGMRGLHEALFGDGYFVYDEQQPQVVVSGLDTELSYQKLKRATLAIRAGARYIATNPDRTLPIDEGLVPGAGSIIALLQAATDMTPMVIGKPGPVMFHTAIDMLQATPECTLAIGDRLDTDIAGAAGAGLASALVLTGVSTQAEVDAGTIKPNAVFAGLPELTAALTG